MHEQTFGENEFFGSKVLNDISEFILRSDPIVANRRSDNPKHVQHKIFTRDSFGEN